MTTSLIVVIVIVSIVVPLAIIGVVIALVMRGLRGTGGLGLGGGKAFAQAPLAIGTVVSASRTGLTVNDVPQMAVVLDVERPDGPPFRAEAKQMVDFTDMAALQPGTTLPVRYLADPSGSFRVQIASDAAQADVQRVLTQVQLGRGEITPTQLMVSEQGIPAQAVILEMQPTGEVRGNRSVLRLTLQVNPYDSAPFTTTVEKAVPPQALGAVQTGAVVNVHYLPEYPDDLVISFPAN